MLTDLYFNNRVQIPSGTISYFGFLDKLEQLIKTPGLIDLDEADLQTTIFGTTKITIVAIETKGRESI